MQKEFNILKKLYTEKEELLIKFNNLQKFSESKDFRRLENKHRNLLVRQSSIMLLYIETLNDRIEDLSHYIEKKNKI